VLGFNSRSCSLGRHSTLRSSALTVKTVFQIFKPQRLKFTVEMSQYEDWVQNACDDGKWFYASNFGEKKYDGITWHEYVVHDAEFICHLPNVARRRPLYAQLVHATVGYYVALPVAGPFLSPFQFSVTLRWIVSMIQHWVLAVVRNYSKRNYLRVIEHTQRSTDALWFCCINPRLTLTFDIYICNQFNLYTQATGG